jgi:hypothetical protein
MYMAREFRHHRQTARARSNDSHARKGFRPAQVEAERSARPRRYCFYYDEVAEAEAQGLPYVLVPRVLSREEWEKKYCTAGAGEREKK